eukprot:9205413-Pyramimonas_sp.AAC.1
MAQPAEAPPAPGVHDHGIPGGLVELGGGPRVKGPCGGEARQLTSSQRPALPPAAGACSDSMRSDQLAATN